LKVINQILSIMVSLFNISFLTFFSLMIIIVQAKPSLKIVSSTDENKSSKSNPTPLYEIYKAMRVDPQLASVSNQDLVRFIYRHFQHGNNDDIDSIKQKYLNQQNYIQQQQEKLN
jgi:hypothetical protein